MRTTWCISLALALGVSGCGGDESSDEKTPVTHYMDAELATYLPPISRFAGEWDEPGPDAEDFSGPAEGITPCLTRPVTGIVHRAKRYASNTVGSTTNIKVSILDFSSAEAAERFVRSVSDYSACASAGLRFKPLSLDGRCDEKTAAAAHTPGEDGNRAATMACQRANLVAGLGLSEEDMTDGRPFNLEGLQAHFDVIVEHFDRLLKDGRALP